MSPQQRNGARGLAKVGALAALGLAACVVTGLRSTRPGWSPQELEAERRCEAGEPAACNALGRLLLAHVHSAKDLDRGLVLLEAACGQNDPEACAALGAEYRSRGDEQATARARGLLTRACDLRAPEGCTELGQLLQLEDAKGPHDARPALETFHRACDLGDPRGCELYGLAARRLYDGSGSETEEQAFTRACAMGRLPSCDLLAMRQLATPAAHDQGLALLMKTCAGGHEPSCLNACKLFAPIVGTNPSCAQALSAAERACQARDDEGCAIADACRIEAHTEAPAAVVRLHGACDRGISTACFYWADAQEHAGPPPTAVVLDEAQRAYGRSCRGHTAAGRLGCTRFVRLRLAGAVTEQEAAPLAAFLQRSCEQSVGEACCALAEAYTKGRGVTADAGKATALRAKACGLGVQPCCHTNE